MREFDSGIDLSSLLSLKPSAEDLAWDHAMDISGSIYARLKELSMTQKDLADALGVSAGRISQIIKGEPGMSIRTLAKIESALDFDLGSGFTYLPEKSQHSVTSSSRFVDKTTDGKWGETHPKNEDLSSATRHKGYTWIKGGLAA